NPQQGRFAQVDPMGMGAVNPVNPQTLNLYAYCINDPVNRTDPTGLIGWVKGFAIAGGLIAAGIVAGALAAPLIIPAVLVGAGIAGAGNLIAQAIQHPDQEANGKSFAVATIIGGVSSAIAPGVSSAAALLEETAISGEFTIGVTSAQTLFGAASNVVQTVTTNYVNNDSTT